MNRRELFRFLPGAAALAIPGVAAAATPEKPLDPWVEYVCPARFGREENWEDRTPCGTRFKSIRGAQPVCPKCTTTMMGKRENVVGIEVK